MNSLVSVLVMSLAMILTTTIFYDESIFYFSCAGHPTMKKQKVLQYKILVLPRILSAYRLFHHRNCFCVLCAYHSIGCFVLAQEASGQIEHASSYCSFHQWVAAVCHCPNKNMMLMMIWPMSDALFVGAPLPAGTAAVATSPARR